MARPYCCLRAGSVRPHLYSSLAEGHGPTFSPTSLLRAAMQRLRALGPQRGEVRGDAPWVVLLREELLLPMCNTAAFSSGFPTAALCLEGGQPEIYPYYHNPELLHVNLETDDHFNKRNSSCTLTRGVTDCTHQHRATAMSTFTTTKLSEVKQTIHYAITCSFSSN